MPVFRTLLSVTVPALLAACSGAPAARSTQCLAPANPGGGWDLTCRSVGSVLARLDLVDGMVQVTNMPGAGGGVAYAHVVTQREDDPDLIVAASPSTTLNLAQGLYGRLTVHDVRWVAAVGTEYGVLAVRDDAPWDDLEDLMAYWRRDPGGLIVGGGSAVASQDHMKVMLLARAAGIDPRQLRYVPFDGGGEAVTTMLGGFVDLFSGEASEVAGQVEAGTVRILTVLADRRLSGELADIPTARESGYDVVWPTWRGFYAPEAIADSAYEGWVDRLTRLARSPEWARARERYRLEPFFLAGDAFAAFVDEQVASFEAVAREIGLAR